VEHTDLLGEKYGLKRLSLGLDRRTVTAVAKKASGVSDRDGVKSKGSGEGGEHTGP
jgi:hypothetical protein